MRLLKLADEIIMTPVSSVMKLNFYQEPLKTFKQGMSVTLEARNTWVENGSG